MYCISECLLIRAIFGTHRPPGEISLGRCLTYCFYKSLWPQRGQDCPTDQKQRIRTLSKNSHDVIISISSEKGVEYRTNVDSLVDVSKLAFSYTAAQLNSLSLDLIIPG